LAEQVAEDHLAAEGSKLRDRGATALGENLVAELLEGDDAGAEVAAGAAGAGELALGGEGGLAREDPEDRRAERIGAQGLDNLREAAVRLAGAGAADDELDGPAAGIVTEMLGTTRVKARVTECYETLHF
jgi:hypothetical protein